MYIGWGHRHTELFSPGPLVRKLLPRYHLIEKQSIVDEAIAANSAVILIIDQEIQVFSQTTFIENGEKMVD